ncbi:hemagglutinin repeat-containing protein [Pseudomonas sp. X10]
MNIPSSHLDLRPDILRWAIFLCLLAPCAALADGGLTPASGPGGTPLINNGHGVPVIDIVAPNARGLSHNQFLDYNVGKPGLVLNNATQAGQSQLAGALAANPQFQGQAASTILNEVISRNASLIEGPQEIFGRPADYVLANPNGITLNGGSFINTTRAGFLVGSPDIQEQQLKHLDTLKASGSLQVLKDGQSNAEGALELIAPRIESLGPLEARDDLTLTAGRNRIDAASGQVLRHLPGTSSSLDASLFGAMRAGRIRIVSTAEGAGVRMGAVDVAGRDGIHISSSGSLTVNGTGQKHALLHSEQGTLSLGARDDLELSATVGKAERIDVKAGKDLTLSTQTREAIKRDRDSWNKKAWFITTETYSREATRTDREHVGSELQASADVALQSGQDMRLKGAKVEAGGTLSADSKGQMGILAVHDSSQEDVKVRHRKHLWRGDSDSSQYQEKAVQSRLHGEQVALSSGGDFKLQGSSVTSRSDMTIKAQQVEITDTLLKHQGSSRDYRGDLVSGTFFGDRAGDDRHDEQAVGSHVQSGGELSVSAHRVGIKGSTLDSTGDAILYSDKALLSVESAQSTSSSSQHESDSKLFGLIGKKREHNSSTQDVLVSDVSSKSNLRLASADELKVHGARLSAGQQLQLEAQKDISIASAQAQVSQETSEQDRGFTASAGQTQQAQDGKPESRQYNASLSYEVKQVTRKETHNTQVGSELSGASVDIKNGAHLQVNGSKVSASDGDLVLQAKQLTLGASRNEKNAQTSTTQSGGGLALSGGIDRLGSAFEGHRNQETLSEQDTLHQRSELGASGDVKITASELVTEAAKVDAGKQLLVEAEQVENRVVEDRQKRSQTTNNWRGSLGGSVEYRGLTRPIENLINGQEASRFQQASVEDSLAAPSAGADLTLSHLSRQAEDIKGTAQVSELTGGTVTVKATTIDDQGTAYRATQGKLQIQAQSHHLNAARDTQQNHVQRLDFDTDLRVDTNTGEDINVRLAGKGGSLDKRNVGETARPGSLYGQTGIQVQLGSDGRYEGSRIDAGEGSLALTSAGSLTLAQATDRHRQEEKSLDGNGWAKGGNSPLGTGLEARGYLNHRQQQNQDTQARIAEIDAKGDVTIKSGGDLLLEGTRIGSRDAKVENIRLDSDGLLQVKAASNTHEAKGSQLGGGLEASGKKGTSSGGSLGGHIGSGRIDEQATTASAASFTAKKQLSLASHAREDQALHLQGLQASAGQIDLKTEHGGMLVESSSNTDRRDNLDIKAGAGFNKAQGATAELNTSGLHGRVQVAMDKRNNLSHGNSQLRADRIVIDSLDDTRLEGAQVDAKQVTGQVGGDLVVASRKDSVDSLELKVDGRLSKEKNPQGYTNAATALAGPAGGKVAEKAGPTLSKAEPGLSPTFSLDLSRTQSDTVPHQSTLSGRDGIDLQVTGETRLTGAKLHAANGRIDLGGSPVTQETLNSRDYRRDVALDASNAPVDLTTAVVDAIKNRDASSGENALDLGLLRTSGHDRSSQLASSLQQKEVRQP